MDQEHIRNKIILPDDELVAEHDNNMEDLLSENINELEEITGENFNIKEQKPSDTVNPSIAEEPKRESHVIIDEPPGPEEDFFETKADEIQITQGDIQGMNEVEPDEDEESKDRLSFRDSVRPSTVAETFTQELRKSQNESTADAIEDAEFLSSNKVQLVVTESIDLSKMDTSDNKANKLEELKTEGLETMAPSGAQIAYRSSRVSYAPIQTLSYQLESRITSNTDQNEDLMEFFDIAKQQDFVLFDDQVESVEEECTISAIEEETSALDRAIYYEQYDVATNELSERRIKNHILQKMVIMYLKRRKVENFLKDLMEPPLDQVYKYAQKLDAFSELLEINRTQRETAVSELNDLREKREEKYHELIQAFKTLQFREETVSHGLIYAKTGNQISDKIVDRLIKRQSYQMDQVSQMRLKYIKLKEMVQEKLNAIDDIDNLENNLHLSDYEQLKVDNRNYSDKIEEREEELARLRQKCQNTIQVLAHMREKSAALDSDLMDLQDEYEYSASTAHSYRESLADLKHNRDKLRTMSRNIKEQSGLLIQTELLKDMEASQNEKQELKHELIRLKNEVQRKECRVRKLRRCIETLTEELLMSKKSKKNKSDNVLILKRKSLKQKQQDENKFYKGKPSLCMPIVPHKAFDDLVKIRPTPQVNSKKK